MTFPSLPSQGNPWLPWGQAVHNTLTGLGPASEAERAALAERMAVRILAEANAIAAETIPGASVGATSAADAATTISGGVDVNAYPGEAALNPAMRFTKSHAIQGGGGYPFSFAVKASGLDSTLGTLDLAAEFIYSGDQFEVVYAAQGATKTMRVWADGLLVGSRPGSGDGSLHRNLVTLPDARNRLIRVEFFGGGTFYAIARQPSATLAYPATKPKGARFIVLGDSYAEGTGATDLVDAFPNRLGEYMGWVDTWRSGSGGTGYLAPGPPDRKKFRDRVQTDVIDQAPNVVLIAGGLNDHGDYSASAIGTEAGLLYDQILTGLPTVELVIVGPWWPSGSPVPTLLAARDALKAEADERDLYFIDPVAEQWITGTGRVDAPNGTGNADIYISADGVHPTTAGHRYLARRLAGHMRTLGATAV